MVFGNTQENKEWKIRYNHELQPIYQYEDDQQSGSCNRTVDDQTILGKEVTEEQNG